MSQHIRAPKTEEDYLFNYPSTFRKNDTELKKKFAERLKAIRKKRAAESLEGVNESLVGNRKNWSQSAIARELGVGNMAYSKYENAKVHIPMKHLPTLCDIFDVTPHYLLGYANGEHNVVELDENNEIVEEDGHPKELTYAFIVPNSIQTKALDSYRNLIFENPQLFHLIRKLMYAPENKKSICITVLSALLGDL